MHLGYYATLFAELVGPAGQVLVIPPNVPHKAEALEDTLDVDVFSPPRQDRRCP